MDYRGKSILIAGGAGSIGNATARMAIERGFSEILLLDIDENGLAETVMRFEESGFHKMSAFVCDIKSETHMGNIFKLNPDVVVNCAAHKHVVTSERNVSQTVYNNLLTTKRLVDEVKRRNSKVYIHISTDKAVEPTSVMGASKMLCESLVRSSCPSGRSNAKTKWYIVRFGNVLGSQGSVLKIWTRQLAEGKPLTVTNPDMKRYCISVKNACDLILRLPEYPSGTYVLDMGTVLTVRELLQRFLWPDELEDHEVIMIGTKTGEKEEEMLFWPEEVVKELSVRGKKLYNVENSPTFPTKTALETAGSFDDKATMRILKSLFPRLGSWEGQ